MGHRPAFKPKAAAPGLPGVAEWIAIPPLSNAVATRRSVEALPQEFHSESRIGELARRQFACGTESLAISLFPTNSGRRVRPRARARYLLFRSNPCRVPALP